MRLLLILTKNGHAIPRAVDDADNDERGFRCAVVDHVVPVNVCSQTGREVVAAWSKLRVVAQGFKFLLDLPDERVRLFRRVFGDEGPDFGDIVLGPVGYAEDERSDDFRSPFLIIRSASKSRTRPASISSIPA